MQTIPNKTIYFDCPHCGKREVYSLPDFLPGVEDREVFKELCEACNVIFDLAREGYKTAKMLYVQMENKYVVDWSDYRI